MRGANTYLQPFWSGEVLGWEKFRPVLENILEQRHGRVKQLIRSAAGVLSRPCHHRKLLRSFTGFGKSAKAEQVQVLVAFAATRSTYTHHSR